MRRPAPGPAAAIAAAAVALRLAVAAAAAAAVGAAAFHAPDTSSYLEPAASLLHDGTFARGGEPELVRTPAYPLLLVPGLVAGQVEGVTIALQALLCGLAVLAVHGLARELFGPVAAVAAAGLLALEPLSILYAGKLLSETLFAACLTGALWRLATLWRRGAAAGAWAAAGGLLAAATLTRPIAYPLAAAAVLASAWRARRGSATWPTVAVLAACALGPPLAWQARNAVRAGYSGLAAIADVNAYFYYGAATRAACEGRSFYEVQDELGYHDLEVYLARHPEQRSWTAARRLAWMGDEGAAAVLAHPLTYAGIHLRGVARVLVDPGGVEYLRLFGAYPERGGGLLGRVVDDGLLATALHVVRQRPLLAVVEAAFGLALAALYALAVLGLRRVAPGAHALAAACLVTAAFLALAAGGPNSLSRFRHPLMPILCTFAGAGLHAAWTARVGRARRRAGPTWAGPILGVALLAAVPGDAQTWRQLEAPGPSARRNAAAVYDPAGRRVVLFGGRDAAGDQNDVWALDVAASTWRQITPDGPAPTPRFTHNAVYDPAGHRALIWSGRMVTSAGSTLLNDVWAFDLATERWQALTALNEPPAPRYGTAAVFDPQAGALVTFAGFTTQGRFDDTWRFDGTTHRWQEVVAPDRPGERCLHAAAYDSRRHRMVIFGGQRGEESLDDAWALDLAADAWEPLAPAVAAGGRRFPAAAYDPAGDRVLVFGGEATDGAKGGDLWALDLAADAWSVLTTAGPEPRDGAVLVYASADDEAGTPRLVLFGGTGSQHLADTWILPLEAVGTAVAAGGAATPIALGLEAFPNPFNAAVTIAVALPAPGALVVRDALGRTVRELGRVPAGRHRLAWDGADDGGRAVASGVYLAELRTGAARRTARLVLLR